MSALVYLKDSTDEKLCQDIQALFEEKIESCDCGISRVFTRKEAADEGLAENFSLVLECDGHSGFGLNWTGPYEVPHPDGKLKGNHGFYPDFGPRPFFLGYGPAFCEGAVLEDARLIDGAPTYAKILGVNLPDAQGQALTELLK